MKHLVALTLSVLFLLGEGRASAPPNIILIVADDLGFECLGAYGGVSYKTPRLDLLAARGVLFANCHSQPLCTHSRLQLMTGLYNDRNYVAFEQIPLDATTFGHRLQAAGYRTAIVGKWQLANIDLVSSFGFDEHSLFDPTEVGGSRYAQPTLTTNGETAEFPQKYGPEVLNAYAVDFVQRMTAVGERYFLYYPMVLPHYPWEPTPNHPHWDPDREWSGDDSANKGDPKYFRAMVRYLDNMVGNVVRAVNRSGTRRDTLIIFCGDNGCDPAVSSQLATGEWIVGGKGKLIDSGTHVPLIASWPGSMPQNEISPVIVDLTDIVPTLLAAAGAPTAAGLDGFRIRDIVAGPGPDRSWRYHWYRRRAAVGGELLIAAANPNWFVYDDGQIFLHRIDPDQSEPRDYATLTAGQMRQVDRLQGIMDARGGP